VVSIFAGLAGVKKTPGEKHVTRNFPVLPSSRSVNFPHKIYNPRNEVRITWHIIALFANVKNRFGRLVFGENLTDQRNNSINVKSVTGKQ
jgi:hypothetical protein